MMNASPQDGSEPDAIQLSIVIPLYNEEESVGPLIAALKETFAEEPSRLEIILVDDGSIDQTYSNATAAADASGLPIHIVSLYRNFGQTAAMQAGIDAAQGRLIATLDGDLQNDPADIPKMVAHLEANQLDLLVGRRKKRQDGFLLRLVPSWIANRLIAKVTGVQIRDYGCSLKIYRASVIKQVKLIGEMHRFIPAWVAAVTHPSRISEIEVRHQARQYGSSKYGISRTIRVVLDLLSVLFFMKYRARPGHFFGSVGLFVGAIGMLMLGSLGVAKFAFGQDIGTRPMLLIGTIATLSSLQLICFGVMAEMLSRIYYQSSSQPGYFTRHHHTTLAANAHAANVASGRGDASGSVSVPRDYLLPLPHSPSETPRERRAG
ncbi:glycosyltransferase family 2 protein [Novipirellula caenicola]|uniref:Dodecaprenyl-phosphate galacturonate synthase n=1 Tax=Novipirellula caenicola TaxID=1536901 RepID=A0ABP9VT07_9BACT